MADSQVRGMNKTRCCRWWWWWSWNFHARSGKLGHWSITVRGKSRISTGDQTLCFRLEAETGNESVSKWDRRGDESFQIRTADVSGTNADLYEESELFFESPLQHNSQDTWRTVGQSHQPENTTVQVIRTSVLRPRLCSRSQQNKFVVRIIEQFLKTFLLNVRTLRFPVSSPDAVYKLIISHNYLCDWWCYTGTTAINQTHVTISSPGDLLVDFRSPSLVVFDERALRSSDWPVKCHSFVSDVHFWCWSVERYI